MARPTRGFSLLDLSVAIALLAILAAMAAPVLRRARAEIAVEKSMLQAEVWSRGWTAYAMNNREFVVPASPNWNWVHPNAASTRFRMLPPDLFHPSNQMIGGAIKTHVMHMLPFIEGGLDFVQLDAETRSAFDARSGTPTPLTYAGVTYNGYDSDSLRQSAYAFHPNLGYNGIFVGGSYRHGAYRDGDADTNNFNGGHFYARSLTRINNPHLLINFAHARGADVRGTAFRSFGANQPEPVTQANPLRPGHWLVTPPRIGQVSSIASGQIGSWSSSPLHQSYNPALAPSLWGNVDFGLEGNTKTLVVTADGAASLRTLAEMRDMRRWANQAKRADWQWARGDNAE